MRTCARLGIRTVAVYSDADWASPHVRAADEAVRIGAGPAAESYLRVDALLNAAAATGAEAVHPGYGFLSESASFAEACLGAGLAWVGPPAAAMRALGDKAHAKALAASAGVPILPGYHGEDATDEALRRAADGVGYPLLVKASAGGGGRGMRVVREPAELDEALAAARREAAAVVRRRPAPARAVPRAPAPRGGPGPRRCPRLGRAPGRARVQRPAAAPEADRGVAVARGVRGAADARWGRRPCAWSTRRDTRARARSSSCSTRPARSSSSRSTRGSRSSTR